MVVFDVYNTLLSFDFINDGCRQVLFTYHGHTSDVHLILPFAHHLISVDVTSTVKIWVIREQGYTFHYFALCRDSGCKVV